MCKSWGRKRQESCPGILSLLALVALASCAGRVEGPIPRNKLNIQTRSFLIGGSTLTLALTVPAANTGALAKANAAFLQAQSIASGILTGTSEADRTACREAVKATAEAYLAFPGKETAVLQAEMPEVSRDLHEMRDSDASAPAASVLLSALAVDRIARLLDKSPFFGFAVNLAGISRAGGLGPLGAPGWDTPVIHPQVAGLAVANVHLKSGGIAAFQPDRPSPVEPVATVGVQASSALEAAAFAWAGCRLPRTWVLAVLERKEPLEGIVMGKPEGKGAVPMEKDVYPTSGFIQNLLPFETGLPGRFEHEVVGTQTIPPSAKLKAVDGTSETP